MTVYWYIINFYGYGHVANVATENFVMSSNRSIVFAPPILLSSITGSTDTCNLSVYKGRTIRKVMGAFCAGGVGKKKKKSRRRNRKKKFVHQL